MNLIFTSCTFGYLAKARVLAQSFKKYNSDYEFALVMIDKEPEGFIFNLAEEPFDTVYYIEDMGLENYESWMFGHDVVELCTAVKGPFLKKFTNMGYDKIIYLDPDIAVYNSLSPIIDLLDSHSIIVTPHLVTPEDEENAILDNEFAALNYGVFNLGFLAIRNDANGKRLANWWNDRLLEYCHDDLPRGLFVDQKWFNLVPALFDGVYILRDPGYNVASWNLSHRKISITNKCIYVNGIFPLRFYHYTKLGPVGRTMTKRYAKDNHEVFEIWNKYEHMVEENTPLNLPSKWWYYGMYRDGTPIEKAERVRYRSMPNLKNVFPHPFSQKDAIRNESGFGKEIGHVLIENNSVASISKHKKRKTIGTFIEKNTRSLRRFFEKNTRSIRRLFK